MSAITSHSLTRHEFGQRLQRLMLTRSWNQSDMARAAGLGRDSISTYVNGKTFPTPVALKKLADALGMEPNELLPKTIKGEVDDDHPAFEMRQATGRPGSAWIRMNRSVSFSAATRIAEIIQQDDQHDVGS